MNFIIDQKNITHNGMIEDNKMTIEQYDLFFENMPSDIMDLEHYSYINCRDNSDEFFYFFVFENYFIDVYEKEIDVFKRI